MGESKPEPKPDKKRVTLRDVAEEAGVSLKTASNVINHSGRMTDSTREKVQEVIDRLGYRVNVSARNLNRGKTGFITLAVPTLTAPYLSELANRVIDAARGYGYSVYVTTYAEGSAQGAQSLLRNFNTTVSDGMILSISEVENLEAADLDVDYPLVLVGERIFTDKVDHIATENVEGAKRATSYLLQTGCKRVAVVGVHPGEKVGSAALRYQGYLEALEEAGVEFDERLVVESGMWHRSDGVRVMNALLDSGVVPDGVVALNDMLASGVMHAIQMHNLRIPEDISVIGFDNSDDSQYLSPALTSIAPGLEAVARLSVKLLKDRIDGVSPSVPIQK